MNAQNNSRSLGASDFGLTLSFNDVGDRLIDLGWFSHGT
jgi:hypothetical protein